jgi:hypothetical protein
MKYTSVCTPPIASTTESVKDSSDILWVQATRVSNIWVQLIQNEHLIGRVSTSDSENTPMCVVYLHENGPYLSILYKLSCFFYSSLHSLFY